MLLAVTVRQEGACPTGLRPNKILAYSWYVRGLHYRLTALEQVNRYHALQLQLAHVSHFALTIALLAISLTSYFCYHYPTAARRGLAMWVLAIEAMDVEMIQAAMKVNLRYAHFNPTRCCRELAWNRHYFM